MRKYILAAALIAPAIAFAPASAFAHYCKSHHHHHHHHHHAKADDGAYGSSKTMKKDEMGSTSSGSKNLNKNQDMNKDTTGGSSGTTY
ncbi:hypothetical protein [Methylocystis echinoides]|uniref:Uncharacterized protein n=1 Tax=Methylocystis echinoides TaxID=29468 RepID=A0A9W6GXP3_9HYPH|nr:hypothetical protein [Methylocystis echinoides]GLI95006.1 hypothetical protein LMG27198_39980 [Methylocystis echinoides]